MYLMNLSIIVFNGFVEIANLNTVTEEGFCKTIRFRKSDPRLWKELGVGITAKHRIHGRALADEEYRKYANFIKEISD